MITCKSQKNRKTQIFSQIYLNCSLKAKANKIAKSEYLEINVKCCFNVDAKR